MTKNEIRNTIATELLESGWLRQTASNLLRTSDKTVLDDFVSEICLIILEFKPVSKIYSAYKKNETMYFVLRLMKNQIYTANSQYNKKFNPKNTVYLDDYMLNNNNINYNNNNLEENEY